MLKALSVGASASAASADVTALEVGDDASQGGCGVGDRGGHAGLVVAGVEVINEKGSCEGVDGSSVVDVLYVAVAVYGCLAFSLVKLATHGGMPCQESSLNLRVPSPLWVGVQRMGIAEVFDGVYAPARDRKYAWGHTVVLWLACPGLTFQSNVRFRCRSRRVR